MKDRIRRSLGSFFISVTLINLVMFLLGLLFRPDQTFGYEVFVYPILYGLIAQVPNFVLNSDREMTFRQAIISKVLRMLLITVLLTAFIFSGTPLTRSSLIPMACVAVSVMLIYIAVVLISWFLDLKTAREMNTELMRFQAGSDKLLS